jgi:hypothetical protein
MLISSKSRIVKLIFLMVFSLIAANAYAAAPTFPGGLIIDHTSAADFDSIPDEWLTAAKAQYRLSYGHTSHGSQVVTGMEMLSSENSLYNYTTGDSGFLCDYCIPGANDLGNPDFTSWATATRTYLNGDGNNRNAIMWSWCGEVSGASKSDIADYYLANMAQLEEDFPNVSFIYMTGHLDGSGESGNLKIRNAQIRNYAKANNKVLFDFADIESYDPAGNYYPNESDACGWCTTWCSQHTCPSCDDCAHSHCFNCYNKGKAFWYMMARLAGWEGPSGCETPPVRISPTYEYYTTVMNAYNDSSSGQTIQLRATTFTENVNIIRSGTITFKGGYSCDYSSRSGFSYVKGKMTVRNATAKVDRLIIK